jgi:hypothetical protein
MTVAIRFRLSWQVRSAGVSPARARPVGVPPTVAWNEDDRK